MPSFVCDKCQETLKKAKLDIHATRCRGSSFSCIDCYRSFKDVEYRTHFSCITEVEKYEKKRPVTSPAPQSVPISTVHKQITKKSLKNNDPEDSNQSKRAKGTEDQNPHNFERTMRKLLGASCESPTFGEIKLYLIKNHPDKRKKEIKSFLDSALVAHIDDKTGAIFFKLSSSQ